MWRSIGRHVGTRSLMPTSSTPTHRLSPGPNWVMIRRVTSWLALTGPGNLLELVVIVAEDDVLVITR